MPSFPLNFGLNYGSTPLNKANTSIALNLSNYPEATANSYRNYNSNNHNASSTFNPYASIGKSYRTNFAIDQY
jgi:hypothetical protein